MTRSVKRPRAVSPFDPVATNCTESVPSVFGSIAPGPGVSSWIAHWMGEISSSGAGGLLPPSRGVCGRSLCCGEPHGVAVHHIESEFGGDHVRWSVTHEASHERIHERAAAEPQVAYLNAGVSRRDHGPDASGARGVGTVADRAAVVQPHRPARRCRLQWSIRTQCDQIYLFVVREGR